MKRKALILIFVHYVLHKNTGQLSSRIVTLTHALNLFRICSPQNRVYTRHWHSEHSTHFLWGVDRKNLCFLVKCCPLVRHNDKSYKHTFDGYNFLGMVLNPVEEYIFCLSGITFVPSQVRNKKVRRYVSSMRKKDRVPFSKKFPNVDPCQYNPWRSVSLWVEGPTN